MKVGGGVAKFVVVREDKDMAAVAATCAVVLSSSRTPPCIRNSPHNYVILRDETPNLPASQSHTSKGSNISPQCLFPLSLSPPICRRRAAEVVTRRLRFPGVDAPPYPSTAL